MKSLQILPRVFYFVILWTLAFVNTSPAALQSKKIETTSKRLTTTALSLQSMPVSVSKATARLVGKQTVLTYSVLNNSREQIETVDVAVLILAPSGYIKGGEGWEVTLNLKAGSVERFPRILESKFESGDRLVISITRAGGRRETFESRPSEMVDTIKSSVIGRSTNQLIPRRINVSFQGTETFCQRAEKAAEAACKCGVQSFSCNETARTYSYTCFPRTNCGDGPSPIQP